MTESDLIVDKIKNTDPYSSMKIVAIHVDQLETDLKLLNRAINYNTKSVEVMNVALKSRVDTSEFMKRILLIETLNLIARSVVMFGVFGLIFYAVWMAYFG